MRLITRICDRAALWVPLLKGKSQEVWRDKVADGPGGPGVVSAADTGQRCAQTVTHRDSRETARTLGAGQGTSLRVCCRWSPPRWQKADGSVGICDSLDNIILNRSHLCVQTSNIMSSPRPVAGIDGTSFIHFGCQCLPLMFEDGGSARSALLHNAEQKSLNLAHKTLTVNFTRKCYSTPFHKFLMMVGNN